ncbi:nucleotidyltransferase family protein [Candidatus Woesearchaeota archaeon]|nr:nucleotidyltransferase family protein [Candidatus Woesearchaeota archaeon]
MRAIILAAGYGTRLEKGLNELKINNPEKHTQISPFIKGKAKPLVIIAGKPMIEYTLDNLKRAGIDQVYVVTNEKFFIDFKDWHNGYQGDVNVKIINDNTNSNDKRLGTVGDLKFVLEKEKIEDNTLVLSGDNLFIFEIKDMVEYYNEKQENIALVYKEKDKERIKKSGNAVFDENKQIMLFKEKPENPVSEWICPAIYIYTSETLRLIKETSFQGDKKDLIGNIIVMFHTAIPFYAFTREEKIRFDLGSIDDFEDADRYMMSKKR